MELKLSSPIRTLICSLGSWTCLLDDLVENCDSQLLMAAMREISATLLSISKPHASPFQLLFLRRNTSKVFVKGTHFLSGVLRSSLVSDFEFFKTWDSVNSSLIFDCLQIWVTFKPQLFWFIKKIKIKRD